VPQKTQEDDLFKLFHQFGADPTSVRIKQDASGVRRYGFVVVPSDAQATAAIEQLNNSTFFGREICVTHSNPGAGRRAGGPVRGGQFGPGKTNICRHFQEGNCTFGNNCNFIHDTNGISNGFNNNNNNNGFNNGFNNNGFNNGYNNGFNPNNNGYNNNQGWNNNANNWNNEFNTDPSYNNPGRNNGRGGWGNPDWSNNNFDNQGGDWGSSYSGGGRYGYNSNQGNFRRPRGPTGGDPEKYKTVPCNLWAKGTCAYGEQCSFIHSGPPGNANASGNNNNNMNNNNSNNMNNNNNNPNGINNNNNNYNQQNQYNNPNNIQPQYSNSFDVSGGYIGSS